ncbi:XRE family transcriptional regulator [Corynebacterium sp. HMSC075D04]|uniref:XRE family transcriptional regulator n=1 Tax=Corynebacterium sp. HMSC075D04 TaxID=1739540 RepID=UPI001439C231|nr:XRE family transcriptional regulator [Corynebacterium sp. HMSC075D04]
MFEPSQLTLVRELEGVAKNQLADDLGVSAATITGWEKGMKSPTPANVTRLAFRFGVTREFFTYMPAGEFARPDETFFRSLRSTTAKERSKSNAFVGVVERIISSFEPLVHFPSYRWSETSDAESPELAARKIRKELGLGLEPIRDLMEIVEDAGVFAVYGPKSSSSVDAFSRFHISNPVLVMNPAKNDYYRQRFDVAHELGHIVMHRGDQAGSREIESEANRFASEFLMPSEALTDVLPTKMDRSGWAYLKALKEEWGVSMQALLYRSRSLQSISEQAYRNAMVTVSKRGWRRSEPGNRKILEMPSLLPSAVSLLNQDGYSNAQLAENAGVPLHAFEIAVRHTPTLSVNP